MNESTPGCIDLSVTRSRSRTISPALFRWPAGVVAGALAVGLFAEKPLPFWQSKPFPKWTLEECEQMLYRSPWSRLVRRYTRAWETRFQVRFLSARPVLLARAVMTQRVPYVVPDTGSPGGFLRATPIDPVQAQKYVQSLLVPGEILVEVKGFSPSYLIDPDYKDEELVGPTYLRFRTEDRDFKVPLSAYVPAWRSPTLHALFRFERPEGIRPPGTVVFYTEKLPDMERPRRFRFRHKLKARFPLEEMVFEDRLTF